MRVRSIAAALLAALAAGCAFDLVHVQHAPATLVQATAARPSFTLARAVPLDIGFGYRRVLREGSTWTYVGSVPAGDVYRSSDQVLTIEASNIHEAYPVIADGRLVGFYLPVEKAYSPAANVVPLPRQ